MLSKFNVFSRDKKEEQPEDWPEYASFLETSVEEFKRSTSDLCKDFQNYLLIGKKNKKYPERQVATRLARSQEKINPDDKLLLHTMRVTADSMLATADCQQHYDALMSDQVLDPLIKLCDETCTNIFNHRRNLRKSLTDLRSTKEHLRKLTLDGHVTTPSSLFNSSTVTSDVVNKIDQCQNNLYDRECDCRTAKENLLRSLYAFGCDEESRICLILKYFELKNSLFQECSRICEKSTAELMELIPKYKRPNTFKVSLADHLRETGRTISYVLETCIEYLDKDKFLSEEGLFRQPGSQRKVEFLVSALNMMKVDKEVLKHCDGPCVAGALKQYLAALPSSLLTDAFIQKWLTAYKSFNSANLDLIESCVADMPVVDRVNLGYLICFLAKVSEHSERNRMTIENLSIVMAPNIFRLSNSASGPTDNRIGEFFHSNAAGMVLVELLIRNAEKLFAAEQAALDLCTETSVSDSSNASMKNRMSLCITPDNPISKYNKKLYGSQNLLSGGELSFTDEKKATNTDHFPQMNCRSNSIVSLNSRKKCAAPLPPSQPRPSPPQTTSLISDCDEAAASIIVPTKDYQSDTTKVKPSSIQNNCSESADAITESSSEPKSTKDAVTPKRPPPIVVNTVGQSSQNNPNV